MTQDNMLTEMHDFATSTLRLVLPLRVQACLPAQRAAKNLPGALGLDASATLLFAALDFGGPCELLDGRKDLHILYVHQLYSQSSQRGRPEL